MCILYLQDRLATLQGFSSHVTMATIVKSTALELSETSTLQHSLFIREETEAQKDVMSLSNLITCQTPQTQALWKSKFLRGCFYS